MDTLNPGTSEILEALRQAFESPQEGRPAGAFTVAELADRLSRGEMTVRRMIRQQIDADRIECVDITIRQINGVHRTVPAYRLRP